jgi:8-oxo-dGTP diphosphatase
MTSKPRPAAAPSTATSDPSSARVEVVAAVLLREDGRFLLGQRPAGKVYAGYWEFPGGKIEPGESALGALKRELHEELGIGVERAHPWLTREYDYAHAAVRLRFFRVMRWSGEPHARERQRFAWQSPDLISVDPLLPANAPILRALRLPPVYAITNAGKLGERVFLERLERALAGGLRLLQVREKGMAGERLERFATAVVRLARAHGARVLVNADASLAQRAGADGVHLTSAQLREGERRPMTELVAASCHDDGEMARARALGADFVVFGPVLPTPSHPGAAGIGWEALTAKIKDYPLPVYALGGLTPADAEKALACGAHGIAMMRAVWDGGRVQRSPGGASST